MNEKIGVALQGFNFFDQGDIFYRKKDSEFFHKMFKDLLDHGKSLVMTSQSKDLLEYYGQALIARIRKHTKFRIELYFSLSLGIQLETEQVLYKFFPAAECALQAPAPLAPLRSLEVLRAAPNRLYPSDLIAPRRTSPGTFAFC